MEKLKVAFLAGFMDYFSGEGIESFKKSQDDLKKLARQNNFDLYIYNEPISDIKNAAIVRMDMEHKGVDFVLIYHPTYISGDIIFELLRTDSYFGLWAPKEPRPAGPLPLASFVCLNQNTSIATHYFKGSRKKYKWFLGDTNDEYFKYRFEITIRALNVIKRLKNSRVAQLGKIAEGFRNMYYDEREIFKTLGVDVVRDVEIEDVFYEAGKIDKTIVNNEVDKVLKQFSSVSFPKEKIIETIKMFMAVKKICEDNNYDAVAFDCAGKPIKLKGIIACLSNSLLNSYGITAGCEGDMLSTISSYILHLISKKPSAVSDLPAFDDKDDSVLLWHCGSAPFEMADSCGVNCKTVYRSDFAAGTDFEELGPITDMVYRSSDVTVFRLIGESDYFYYFTGKTLGAKKDSWKGSRGWVKDLKLYRDPVKAKDLINTILDKGIPHHFPFIMDDVARYIEEIAYWLNLKRVEVKEYEDFNYI